MCGVHLLRDGLCMWGVHLLRGGLCMWGVHLLRGGLFYERYSFVRNQLNSVRKAAPITEVVIEHTQDKCLK